MTLVEILEKAAILKASDVHMAVGNPVTVRIDGQLQPLGKKALTEEDTLEYARFLLTDSQFQRMVYQEIQDT